MTREATLRKAFWRLRRAVWAHREAWLRTGVWQPPEAIGLGLGDGQAWESYG